VPASSVSALAARADAAASDALVAFGGGACIDTAKSAARSLGQMRPGAPAPPVVVIPSTLVGAELTAVPGTPARIVLYDPEILARVGLSAVLSSGAAAIAHAVEALFAREDPLVETAACEALSRLATALPKFRDDPHDVAAATSLVQGGYLAAFAMARSAMGLAHGICRTIAGRTGVPYAIAHAIILPHAMRYNRAGAVDRLALAGRAIGAAYRSEPDDEAAAKACAAVERLVRALGLPGRLRDAGIEERGLLPLAEAALANPCMNTNPRPIETAGQILGVLRAAW
jgi:maleylacetate reductase